MTHAITDTSPEALEQLIASGATICKHADPVEGAREGLTAEEAADVAREDAGLLYAVHPTPVTDAQIRRLRTEAATAGDLEMVATCDEALAGETFVGHDGPKNTADAARAACAEVIADAQAQS